MSPEKIIDDGGLAGEAYANIRDRILRGELTMGQCLSRRKLAAELGMSFLPVSEALLRLEHEGLLESRPRAGTRVRIPTREDMEGHYVVREALEVKAATLFAEQASRDECSELMKLAGRVDALFHQSGGNQTIYLTLHERLHRRIVECTRCQTLAHMINRLSVFASIWTCKLHPQERGPGTHESLLKGLTADSATAAGAMREHLRFEMEASLNGMNHLFELQNAKHSAYARPKKS